MTQNFESLKVTTKGVRSFYGASPMLSNNKQNRASQIFLKHELMAHYPYNNQRFCIDIKLFRRPNSSWATWSYENLIFEELIMFNVHTNINLSLEL